VDTLTDLFGKNGDKRNSVMWWLWNLFNVLQIFYVT